MRISQILRRSTAALLLGFLAATSSHAFAQKGQTTIGLEAGFASRNTSGYAGVYLRHQFSRIFALKPSCDFIIRHKEKDAYTVMIDAHFLVPLSNPRWSVYGIAGAGFTSWNDPTVDEFGEPGHERYGALALDVGAGCAVNASPTLRLALEVKGNLAEHRNSALACLCIGYNF